MKIHFIYFPCKNPAEVEADNFSNIDEISSSDSLKPPVIHLSDHSHASAHNINMQRRQSLRIVIRPAALPHWHGPVLGGKQKFILKSWITMV